MDPIFAVLICLIPIFILLARRRRRLPSKKLPPGSLGFPIIGQSLSFVRAMRADTVGKWFEERAKQYGQVSKLCLLGKPTVFIYGQAANKFFFTGGDKELSNQQPPSVYKLLGGRNIFELTGEDHKLMRDAFMLFLKPESLKHYVGKMDEEVRRHLQMHWEGKKSVTVLPLMKTLTFSVINSLLFGLERGTQREELVILFGKLMKGLLSVPINFPFTTYNRSVSASARARDILKELIRAKKVELQENNKSSHQDLLTSLLSISGKDGEKIFSDDDIVDNVIVVMIAGHDTSATLTTFIIRQLADDPTLLAGVLQEQEGIARNKPPEELLTWEDLTKMKYTWKVALETLRMFPPAFVSFRKTLKDMEYAGYIIPKGWHILRVASMTNMDDSIFKEPSNFDPERFSDQAGIPSFCFLPFGVGPRMCPGNEFARIQTLVSIHYLVTRFTWNICCSDRSISYAPHPVPAQGLPIEIAPRTGHN